MTMMQLGEVKVIEPTDIKPEVELPTLMTFGFAFMVIRFGMIYDLCVVECGKENPSRQPIQPRSEILFPKGIMGEDPLKLTILSIKDGKAVLQTTFADSKWSRHAGMSEMVNKTINTGRNPNIFKS